MPEQRRIIAVGLVRNANGELLLCKMPSDRGVFPGQWGLPGGGVNADETIEEGLRRELREELGIEVERISPALFKDGEYKKAFSDGSTRTVYMIFLIFDCVAASEDISLNSEFDEFRWVPPAEALNLDLNIETIDTLERALKHSVAARS